MLKLLDDESIVLYFPYREVGGVSVLFLRIARELSKKRKVFLADFSGGYMAKNLPKNCSLIEVDKNPVFPQNAIFIFQAFPIWRLPMIENLPKTCRFLFWVLHPRNFDPNLYEDSDKKNIIKFAVKILNKISFINKVKINNLVRYLEENKSIIYMDREVIRSTEAMLNLKIINPSTLPVPIPQSNYRKLKLLDRKKITIGWIGRLSDFKYQILLHLMERLSAVVNKNLEIKLLIIGDGQYQNLIEEKANSINERNAYKVELIPHIKNQELDKFISKNIDILFAMGTSALEGARVGVPVFLTDYTYGNLRGLYQFKLLYQNSGYCLGENINENSYEKVSSLEKSINYVLDNYSEVSIKSYEYWQQNFSLESTLSKLEKYLELARGTFGDVINSQFKSPPLSMLAIKRFLLIIRKKKSISIENGLRIDC